MEAVQMKLMESKPRLVENTPEPEIPLGANGQPRDLVWDACEEALGYKPLTDSEKSLWGLKVGSLKRAGATPEQVLSVGVWYHRHWPDVDLTIGALEKWFSHFLRMETDRQRKRGATCPDCGLGGGYHLTDCARAPDRS